MLSKGPQNVWSYNRYATNVLSYHIYGMYSHASWKAYSMHASHLVLPRHYSTSGSALKFFFMGRIITMGSMVSRIPSTTTTISLR